MKEQFDLRQSDIQWGQNEAKASMKASIQAVVKQMVQKGEMAQEQMEKFLRYMDEIDQTQEKKTYERTT